MAKVRSPLTATSSGSSTNTRLIASRTRLLGPFPVVPGVGLRFVQCIGAAGLFPHCNKPPEHPGERRTKPRLPGCGAVPATALSAGPMPRAAGILPPHATSRVSSPLVRNSSRRPATVSGVATRPAMLVDPNVQFDTAAIGWHTSQFDAGRATSSRSATERSTSLTLFSARRYRRDNTGG